MEIEVTPPGSRGARMISGPVSKFLIVDLVGAIYRLLGGRGLSSTLLLTTVGAKSGQPRTVPLARFADEDKAWLIVGSAGGAARHPAWFINLARNPEQVWIDVGSRKLKVKPELLQGPAREIRWQRIVKKAPNFAGYQQKTDRLLPVVRLTPAE